MCSFLRLCDHLLPRAEQISILKRLNHRHIVHLREVLASSTKLYLVMDYVNGGELFDLLEEQGALDEDVARRYFHQLVDAINYCHSVGVSHRDLKVRFSFFSSFGVFLFPSMARLTCSLAVLAMLVGLVH